MSNYKPRYVVEVDAAKHGETHRVPWIATDDKEDAVEFVETLAPERNPAFVDRAFVKRANTAQGTRDRAYYGLPFTSKTLSALDNFMQGRIERRADDALDRLDRLVDTMAHEFVIRHSKVPFPSLTEVLNTEVPGVR